MTLQLKLQSTGTSRVPFIIIQKPSVLRKLLYMFMAIIFCFCRGHTYFSAERKSFVYPDSFSNVDVGTSLTSNFGDIQFIYKTWQLCTFPVTPLFLHIIQNPSHPVLPVLRLLSSLMGCSSSLDMNQHLKTETWLTTNVTDKSVENKQTSL